MEAAFMDDVVVRRATESELEILLALNQKNLPHVGSISLERMKHLFSQAAWFLVAERAGEVAGFVIVFNQAADYDSQNFIWFRERHDSFAYIDRIVVSPRERRKGIASLLYREVEGRAARRGIRLLTCEYNLRPSNEDSRAFHRRFGFEEVGTQDTEGGTKTVSLQAKPVERKN
jgi:predicted GNAT superfamily acetyltransferase